MTNNGANGGIDSKYRFHVEAESIHQNFLDKILWKSQNNIKLYKDFENYILKVPSLQVCKQFSIFYWGFQEQCIQTNSQKLVPPEGCLANAISCRNITNPLGSNY